MSGFLNRWSQRKTDARRDEDRPDPEATPPTELPPATDAPRAEHPEGAATAQPGDSEVAAQIAALPPLDEITAGTDIRPFLQDFVPRALKNAAMRRAWVSDPIISTHLDVARDYAWEFNAGPLPVGFSNGLGADAVQRGLDALNIAPPPERVTEAASPAPDAALPDAALSDDSAAVATPQGGPMAETAPDFTPDPALTLDAPTVPASAPAVSSEPLSPEAPAKTGIRLGLKRHGGALPD